MGYKAGLIALRVMEGESPASIPIMNMNDVRLHINLEAAKNQGLQFPENIVRAADKVDIRHQEGPSFPEYR